MDIPGGLDAALAAVRAVGTRWATASDEEVLSDGAAWEAIGRLVDAHRITFAGCVEDRAERPAPDGGLRLAPRHGLRDGADLLVRTARISRDEAARRVALGTALAPKVSLTGEELPGRYPRLAAAVSAGEVGIDSARILTAMFRSVRRRADATALAEAEVALTAAARELDAEDLRGLAGVWAERLDPDGPRPRETEAFRRRLFTLGRVDEYGGSKFWGYLPPEERAVVAAAIAAHRKTVTMVRSSAGAESNETDGPEWHEAEGDERAAGQVDFDSFYGLLTAGIRASTTETAAAAVLRAIPEVIVTTTLADLESRTGTAILTGTAAAISVESVERISCGSGVRLLVNADEGEALHLGRAARYFTPNQRKTLITRTRGCAWPGCTAPPAWCDTHHIAWFTRDDGPSDMGNGILLCSFHHHLIHDPATRWRIVVHGGQPHLVPKTWTGDPEPRHRRTGRASAPPAEPELWGRPRRT